MDREARGMGLQRRKRVRVQTTAPRPSLVGVWIVRSARVVGCGLLQALQSVGHRSTRPSPHWGLDAGAECLDGS